MSGGPDAGRLSGRRDGAASYEKIEGEQPYYGEIKGFRGLWAAGSTLETCRRNLRLALEDWVFFSVAHEMDLPPATPSFGR